MKSTDFSPQFSEVWGENASSDTITFPIPSTTTTSGRASLDAGFTSVNMTVLAAGGIPPFGQDFNGILKMLSTSARNYESGNVPVWSSAFAAEISGYPQYALVQYEGTYYTSSTDDNTTTPGASGSEWTELLEGYATKISISQFYPCGGSTTLTVPSWATRFEYILTGGGGGGADCQASGSVLTSTNASGGGGGGGGTAIGLQTVTPGSSLSVTIGAGGQAEYDGGASSISYSGTTIATANGGGGAKFPSTALSAGGAGGSASASNGTNITGGNGSDGQNGSFVFAGNGGGSYWGGGGRAGSLGGVSGAPFGAGGGGAYDSTFTGTFSYGGYGSSGFLLYRWLP